ncbi:ATP-dependent helicase [Oecophyllibacter saccharovorans]|uniref:ATP-dependent helicase n=1 Tax=Oecophyllibacter saccharovorans TaxID=2558360 RepID=UPI0011758C5F|nr:DUF3553 domain-containing protein [Oecophyllibacter saccharovorans]TPW35300.1 DUF3553 domain-containing protein [Oecophyllibacter saccharovorans]
MVADDLFPPSSQGAYLSALNDEQRQAVETTEGPLLILAGAGTGKTRVLTTRFAHILLQGHAWPEQILAVTFTNKAAREMRERIGTLLGKPVDSLWLGTFHSLCARMLRRHADLAGLERDFTILDTDDQIRLLKQIMAPFRIDLKRWPAAQILNQIQTWKDRGLLPDAITPAHDEAQVANGHARAVYAAYQNRLRELNACDFGDLMLHMVTIFRTHPDILEYYHKRFHYILVDEYQDTNTIQYLWLRLLAKRPDDRPANIACVGDDDQSIYSWRGADIENILRFEKDFPGAHIVRLERNYRSTPRILGAAAGIIAHNEERLGKTLHAGQQALEGEPVTVINTPDSDDEARTVGGMVQRFHQEGQSLAEMAVLMRAGFQTRPFEESLIRLGIPYQVIGGLRFYERAEIRDGTAYMRALVQPADDLAFERIINTPKRGIGPKSLERLRAMGRKRQLPLQATIRQMLERKELKGKAADELQRLLDAFDRARETLATQGHVVAVEQLLEDSGYLQMWRDDTSIEAPGRLDNLRELLRAIGEFPTLPEFLEHIALVMDSDQLQGQVDRISLMTLHAAKGLEFDTVFLPGWEEGLFPSQRSLDEGGNRALEEERRLAYVGLTRARKRAIILHADSRRLYAGWQESLPSRFLEELPDEHVNRTRLKRPQSSFGAPAFSRRNRLGQDMLAELKATRPPTRNGPAPELGATVRHPRFGVGVVTDIERNRLTIEFEEAGQKHIMADFVEILP